MIKKLNGLMGFGTVLVTFGLAGCLNDGLYPQNAEYRSYNHAMHQRSESDHREHRVHRDQSEHREHSKGESSEATGQKVSNSEGGREIKQKTTPGPKRKAAPQIPVIQ